MITADGYSKDSNLIPEGIMITWGSELIKEKGGLLAFLRYFLINMNQEEGIWMHKCSNKPKSDHRILYVYIICCNTLLYRLSYTGYETGETECHNGNGISWSSKQIITWPRILMNGPVVKAPIKRKLSGFRGFRYCTKLF